METWKHVGYHTIHGMLANRAKNCKYCHFAVDFQSLTRSFSINGLALPQEEKILNGVGRK